ncbi:hypothetical protein OBBRIDRAFT_795499 [Obba rivulosa]|uniref:Uncharacterized protein n=1 Tax=Obba rivulosa TaxID=1052685 RepID=A0A8E2AWX7_9APHY|nr:hypothetical protein OBBRIDRAFT_795499 [Obba rivulosa]
MHQPKTVNRFPSYEVMLPSAFTDAPTLEHSISHQQHTVISESSGVLQQQHPDDAIFAGMSLPDVPDDVLAQVCMGYVGQMNLGTVSGSESLLSDHSNNRHVKHAPSDVSYLNALAGGSRDAEQAGMSAASGTQHQQCGREPIAPQYSRQSRYRTDTKNSTIVNALAAEQGQWSNAATYWGRTTAGPLIDPTHGQYAACQQYAIQQIPSGHSPSTLDSNHTLVAQLRGELTGWNMPSQHPMIAPSPESRDTTPRASTSIPNSQEQSASRSSSSSSPVTPSLLLDSAVQRYANHKVKLVYRMQETGQVTVRRALMFLESLGLIGRFIASPGPKRWIVELQLMLNRALNYLGDPNVIGLLLDGTYEDGVSENHESSVNPGSQPNVDAAPHPMVQPDIRTEDGPQQTRYVHNDRVYKNELTNELKKACDTCSHRSVHEKCIKIPGHSACL